MDESYGAIVYLLYSFIHSSHQMPGYSRCEVNAML
jgi:hypothetical protein